MPSLSQNRISLLFLHPSVLFYGQLPFVSILIVRNAKNTRRIGCLDSYARDNLLKQLGWVVNKRQAPTAETTMIPLVASAPCPALQFVSREAVAAIAWRREGRQGVSVVGQQTLGLLVSRSHVLCSGRACNTRRATPFVGVVFLRFRCVAEVIAETRVRMIVVDVTSFSILAGCCVGARWSRFPTALGTVG
jgi:hypothetical protein